jgi:hypothetical protein
MNPIDSPMIFDSLIRRESFDAGAEPKGRFVIEDIVRTNNQNFGAFSWLLRIAAGVAASH